MLMDYILQAHAQYVWPLIRYILLYMYVYEIACMLTDHTHREIETFVHEWTVGFVPGDSQVGSGLQCPCGSAPQGWSCP